MPVKKLQAEACPMGRLVDGAAIIGEATREVHPIKRS